MQKNDEILKKIRLQKKRKLSGLRFRINTVCLLFLLLVTVVCGVLFFLMPKKKISETENRELTGFPELSLSSVWNGDFTGGLNLYYSDNFAFREQLVRAKFALEEHRGIRFGDVRIYDAAHAGSENGSTPADTDALDSLPQSKDAFFMLEQTKRTEPDAVSLAIDLNNPYYTDPEKHFDLFDKDALNDQFSDYTNMDKSELEGEQRGSLFVIGDTALEIFYGNEKVSEDYAKVINKYAELLGSGVTVYDMIVPNHFEFGLPQKYKGQIGRDEKPFIDLVGDRLDDSVVFVEIYDTLKEHYGKGEYLYFRTDHHWTGLGAYRAYEKFCEYAGFTPVSLDSYEKRTSTGFLGTLYNSCLDKNLAANPDTVEYYVTDLPYVQTNTNKDGSTYRGTLISEYSDGRTNGYLTFMGGDIPLATIQTENENGRKIIVFKESYGNAFVPFLVPHYETVYVADIRSFPYNAIDFIRENGITDVLFVNNIMTSNTSARVANILGLITK
ncbi:MAG: DHHW family protein [Eubacteriales bacterium]